MMDPEQVDETIVDDVPPPRPWGEGDGAPPEVESAEPPAAEPEPLTDAETAKILQVVVEAPFDWTGAWYAHRSPPEIREQVRDVWPLHDDESASIARRLAAAIPERWRSSPLLTGSPLLVAAAEIAAAFRSRTRATAQLLAAYADTAREALSPTDGGSPDGSDAAGDRGNGARPRGRGGRFARRVPAPRRRGDAAPADRSVPGAPAARPAPVNPDGFAGAGLGLEPDRS